MFTEVSEGCKTAIFRVEEQDSVFYLPGLLFDPEDGGNAFLRKFPEHIPDYTT
jgi:hypothetical protein